jgi:hypothetical protein
MPLKNPKNPFFRQQQELLLSLLPIAGIIACALVFLGIIGRAVYIDRLRKELEKLDPDDSSFRDYPPVDATASMRTMERIYTLGLPFCFIIAWLIILM